MSQCPIAGDANAAPHDTNRQSSCVVRKRFLRYCDFMILKVTDVTILDFQIFENFGYPAGWEGYFASSNKIFYENRANGFRDFTTPNIKRQFIYDVNGYGSKTAKIVKSDIAQHHIGI